jgi:hypothetical protein
MKIRKFLKPIYPFLLISALGVVVASERAKAGHIRNLVIRPNEAGRISLCLGRSTAISFPSKPEKIPVGSPQNLKVEFINNTDINVTPLGALPGNMHVYTKSNHYVINFVLGNPNSYDDTVNINYFSVLKPIRLDHDLFQISDFKLKWTSSRFGNTQSKDVHLVVKDAGRSLILDPLAEWIESVALIKCPKCELVNNLQHLTLRCFSAIENLRCESPQFSKIAIEKQGDAQ